MEVTCPNCTGGIVTATGVQCAECGGTGILIFKRVESPVTAQSISAQNEAKVVPAKEKHVKIKDVKPLLKAKKKKHGR